MSNLGRYIKKFFFNFKSKVKNKIIYLNASIVRYIFNKYKIEFIFKDSFGTLSNKLINCENLEYIMRTNYSCDAGPLMQSIDKLRFNTTFDVGANIGIVTTFLAKRSEKCFAFECFDGNYKRCRENLKLNNIHNVQLLPYAISNKSGKSKFYLLKEHGWHSLGKVNTSKIISSIEVETITIDSFCDKNNIDIIDFLKIDVEGFELNVLKGAKRMLHDKRISLIAFEISLVPLKSLNIKPSYVYKFLEDHDYEILNLDNTLFKKGKESNHMDLLAKPKR